MMSFSGGKRSTQARVLRVGVTGPRKDDVAAREQTAAATTHDEACMMDRERTAR
jgi:hypothetical protein